MFIVTLYIYHITDLRHGVNCDFISCKGWLYLISFVNDLATGYKSICSGDVEVYRHSPSCAMFPQSPAYKPATALLKSIRVHLSPRSSCGLVAYTLRILWRNGILSLWDIQLSF